MLKSSAICIKTHCNMPQIGSRFGPNNGVIRIKLQRFMNEITHQMLWRDNISAFNCCSEYDYQDMLSYTISLLFLFFIITFS